MCRDAIGEWSLRVASSLLPGKLKRWLVRSRLLRLAAVVSPTIRERVSVSGISAWQRRHIAQRSVKLRREADWKAMQHLIESALTAKECGLPPAYAREFAAGLRAVGEDAARHGEVTSDLVRGTKRLAATAVDCDHLPYLRQLATCHGLFEVSGAIRALVMETAVARAQPATATENDVLAALQVALDRYDLKSAWALRERLPPMANRQSEVDLTDIDRYMGLLSRTPNGLAVTSEETESGRRWAELVSGWTVALVGPAPSDECSGEQIDGHQTIVRTNFRGAAKLPPPVEAGRRTDISYYNQMDCRHIRAEANRPFLSELRMAVFGQADDTDLAAPTPARVYSPLNYVLPTAGRLMGPIAVFDLLCGGADAVKLYNQNFFVSRRPYFAEYRAESVDAQGRRSDRDHLGSRGALLDRCWTFAFQDLPSHLHFVQNLWRSGLVTADAACTEVLQMSDTDYLRALDDIYGREAR